MKYEYGKVIPVVFGTAKLAPQLIWYGNFGPGK